MQTKKLTAKVPMDLGDELNKLAKEKGWTLSQMVTRMIQNTLDAHRLAGEIREYCD